MMRALAASILVMALAGCADAPEINAGPLEPTAIVAGHVFDPSMRPVEGATVILGGSEINVTNDEGRFEFTTPGNQPVYALRITADGFLARSMTLQSGEASPVFDEQIVLDPIPQIIATRDTQQFTGNIACAFFAQAQHSHGGPGDPGSHDSQDCSEGTNTDVWEFMLEPGVRNVVIEVFWNPNTPLSERLAVFVEGPGLDKGENVLFSFNEGPSGVKANIGLLQTTTYFQENGGPVRVTIKIGAPEEDVAAGAAVNQPFDIFATAFYVLPGDYRFSVLDS